jgi:hypothetical protein
MTFAELTQTRAWADPRNRERVAEAAGLPPASRKQASSLPQDCRQPPAAPDIHALTLAVLGEERRVPRLVGEDGLQAEIVTRLDIGTRAGKWSIVPVILRNDIRVRTASDAELTASPALAHWHQRQQRQAWREGARAKAMGMRPGAPDLLLLSPAGFGFLECKSPGAGLRPEQRAWRDLAAAMGWRWGLARSWDDALRALAAWGWLP